MISCSTKTFFTLFYVTHVHVVPNGLYISDRLCFYLSKSFKYRSILNVIISRRTNKPRTEVRAMFLISTDFISDPTVTYKPEMDYNHNHSDRIPSSTTSSPYGQSLDDQGSHIVTGNDVPGSRVTVEEVNSSRIPLTVTSADDDEIDSGTESIDSKDSEGSLRLSVEDENRPRSKEKTDRKRPGRKKGQGKT